MLVFKNQSSGRCGTAGSGLLENFHNKRSFAAHIVLRYLQSETDKSECHVTFHLKTIVGLDASLKHLCQTTVLQHVQKYYGYEFFNEFTDFKFEFLADWFLKLVFTNLYFKT